MVIEPGAIAQRQFTAPVDRHRGSVCYAATFSKPRWDSAWRPPSSLSAMREPANRLAAGGQRLGDLGNVPALKASNGQLVFARLPRTIGTGQGRCAIGSAAGDFSHASKPLFRIGEADDN